MNATRSIGTLLALGLSLASAPAASAQDKPGFPCEVEVTATTLNLRAGIGQAYVILYIAKKAETLVALEEQLGWYRVKPPAGVHVYLAKEFVDMQGPNLGVVKADRVNARPTADTKHPPVCQFAKGMNVRIVAEVNGWHKVSAPANASCWVKKDFVKFLRPFAGRVDAGDGSSLVDPKTAGVGDTATPPGGAGDPAVPGGLPGAAPGKGAPGTAAPGPVADGKEAAPDFTVKFAEIRRRIAEEEDKPQSEQQYEEIVSALREIAFDPRPSLVKKLAMDELDRLEPLQKILARMREIESEKKRLEAQQIEESRIKAERERRKTVFDGQGWLDGMGKVINRPGTHKLIKGGKILFYLRSYKLNLNDYLGKLIGVRGKLTEAAGWEPKVIEVEELEVLGE